MCGLVGFVGVNEAVRAAGGLETVCSGMADTLAHRGPDDAGVWTDAEAGVALGHRRLAILDLSPAGHQPMVSASGRWVIAFNGEIYNHAELRARVEQAENAGAGGTPKVAWRGHSDTETLLAACERFGVVETLQACVGMFALALWDRRTRTLTLARDRFGEKPLYYGRVGEALVFGSELKALRAFPGFANPICREALHRYLQRLYVPAPLTIYEGIRKLEPGTWLEVPLVGGEAAWRSGRYWSLAAAVEAGARAPITDEGEALERLEARLHESVRLQSLADVPLGAFLSGGVDSATIVALMQHESARRHWFSLVKFYKILIFM